MPDGRALELANRVSVSGFSSRTDAPSTVIHPAPDQLSQGRVQRLRSYANTCRYTGLAHAQPQKVERSRRSIGSWTADRQDAARRREIAGSRSSSSRADGCRKTRGEGKQYIRALTEHLPNVLCGHGNQLRSDVTWARTGIPTAEPFRRGEVSAFAVVPDKYGAWRDVDAHAGMRTSRALAGVRGRNGPRAFRVSAGRFGFLSPSLPSWTAVCILRLPRNRRAGWPLAT